MKLREEKVLAFKKAYQDLVTYVVEQYDAGVDVVIQTVNLLWLDLVISLLEHALSLSSLIPWVVHTYLALHASSSSLPEANLFGFLQQPQVHCYRAHC